MAVPKRRTSHARQGKRRSHLHAKPKQIQYCSRCGAPVLGHHLCWQCGWSNSQGREMVSMEKDEKE
jgi:large subunit ribosomal protein L32